MLRTLLFVIFFGVGAAALSGSILCDDFLRYYRDRQLLKAAEEYANRLESLNQDYDALLENLRRDPNLIKRIAPQTLGLERSDPNTIYPKVRAEQLAAAKKALTEDPRQPTQPAMPKWLTRCSEPRRRKILFGAGAILILVSLVWFGPIRQTDRQNVRHGNEQ